jgi:hypothetical protein
MPLTDPALWNRLQTWPGPRESLHPLVKTMMQVHMVPRKRARAMVEGFARFIYLAAVSDQPLVPPRLIDAVWHEHLADHREGQNGLVTRAIVLFGVFLLPLAVTSPWSLYDHQTRT